MTLDHGDILKTSATVIAKRRESYGEPQACFERASTIATTVLGKPVSPYEIATIFHAMKLARIAESPDNMDHYVDGVSYLAFAGEFYGIGRDGRRETKADLAPFLPLPASRVDGRPVVPLRNLPDTAGKPPNGSAT